MGIHRCCTPGCGRGSLCNTWLNKGTIGSKDQDLQYLSSLVSVSPFFYDNLAKIHMFFTKPYPIIFSDNYTLWGIHSVVNIISVFLTCSTGCWSDTAVTVQPNRDFRKKTKLVD